MGGDGSFNRTMTLKTAIARSDAMVPFVNVRHVQSKA